MSNQIIRELKKSPLILACFENQSIWFFEEFVYFVLAEPCPDWETFSNEALAIQSEMIELGYEGAIIGHPMDDGDLSVIRFFIAKD